ncbi:RagB/SusD family nutrient uptake outer membrane protein [Proteiniphilum sp. UBA1028]|uniref:RagB/SusD family nutrient uptake outer membrane protein n=1 Tax=Proteiniphilum sp. UBA1028 TaxID=1947251 RepID=UPI0025D843AA|nr:RagB/SusD family nutrient uptake outer membrane protein [Proteiniphilum sp. UBA1028]
MNTKFQYKIVSLIIALSFFGACSLEEYNPSGSTASIVFSTEEGMNALVNSAYYNFGAQFYGREDVMFLFEGGTDLWYMGARGTYAEQLLVYTERLDATTGQIKNTWQRLYEIVNYANAGINRIDNVRYTDDNVKLAKEGELRFVRAYAYWMIAETFGGVTLRTTETTGVPLTAKRSPLKDFYDLIISDLERAVQILPYNQDQVGRADKKAAYGMLARTALTRASYLEYFENNRAEANLFYQKALDAANELINNQGQYGCRLYDTYDEVFAPSNNKNNAEALWVITHSTNSALNPQPKNANRLFRWYLAKYTGLCGMPSLEVTEYGRDGASRLMPTKFLLDIFDEDIDARYYGSFREAFNLPLTTQSYSWTTTDIARFEKSFSPGSVVIQPGDTALFYTKKVITDKDSRSYGVKDINDTYNFDGTISTNANNNPYYPSLKKFRDPDRNPGSDAGTKNVVVMRLAEMYLIAAEASYKLNKTSPDAAYYINVLRTRAAVKTPVDHTSQMQVSISDIDLDFLLDERARELAGEHLRWPDLKRTKQLENRLGQGKQNPDITAFNPEKHYLRPIPQAELDVLENAEEYGQNPGY